MPWSSIKWKRQHPERHRAHSRKWYRKKYGCTTTSLRKSSAWKGRRSELLAVKFLGKNVQDNNAEKFSSDIDLIWNGLRVDVKSCNLYHTKTRPGKGKEDRWYFKRGKIDADFYFCICLNQNIPIRYYLIPFSVFGKRATISLKLVRPKRKGKFDQYLIWEAK